MTSQLKYKPYFIYKITGRLVLFFTNLQDAIELKDKITRDVKIPENFEITLDDYFGEFSKNSSVIKNNRLFKKPSISELDKMINDKSEGCYWNRVSLIILTIRVKFNRYGYWAFWENLAKYLNNLEDFILYDFNITPYKRSEILTKRVDGGLGDVDIFLANKEEKEKD